MYVNKKKKEKKKTHTHTKKTTDLCGLRVIEIRLSLIPDTTLLSRKGLFIVSPVWTWGCDKGFLGSEVTPLVSD